MIRINLLPYRAARKVENIRRQIGIFVLSLIFITLALFWFNGFLSNKIQDLDSKVEKTRNEIKTYQAKLKEIAELKKKLEILKHKTQVIGSLQKNRGKAVRLLDNMSKLVIPNRMWFTDFEEKADALIMSGIALDNKTVADFMTRLEGVYSGVNLENLKQTRIRNVNLKSFQINCKKGPPKKVAAGG